MLDICGYVQKRDIETVQAIGFIVVYVLIVVIGQFVNRSVLQRPRSFRRLVTEIRVTQIPYLNANHQPIGPQLYSEKCRCRGLLVKIAMDCLLSNVAAIKCVWSEIER